MQHRRVEIHVPSIGLDIWLDNCVGHCTGGVPEARGLKRGRAANSKDSASWIKSYLQVRGREEDEGSAEEVRWRSFLRGGVERTSLSVVLTYPTR